MPDHPAYRHDAPKIGYANVPCDATLCTDDDGVVGRISALVSHEDGARIESVPIVGNSCSGERVVIWHGMDTPAHACGFHATYGKVAVFRGHRNRVAAASVEGGA